MNRSTAKRVELIESARESEKIELVFHWLRSGMTTDDRGEEVPYVMDDDGSMIIGQDRIRAWKAQQEAQGHIFIKFGHEGSDSEPRGVHG